VRDEVVNLEDVYRIIKLREFEEIEREYLPGQPVK
jgi:hypothetical protein